MRPASLPVNRVPQAAALFHAVYATPFKTFISASNDALAGNYATCTEAQLVPEGR